MKKLTLKDGELFAQKTIAGLILVTLAKITVAFLTGLTVLFADAVSSLTNILSISASYIGIRLSGKAANKNFEYGYYKIETFAAFIISSSIIFAGYLLIQKGITLLSTPEQVSRYLPLVVCISLFSIFNSLHSAKGLNDYGKELNSLSFITNSKEKIVEVAVSLAALISVMASYNEISYLEGVVTICISLIIMYQGAKSMKESLFFLLDYWDDPVLNRKIAAIFKEHSAVVEKIKKIRLRRAGTFIFGEAIVEINPFADVLDIRDELNNIEIKIKALNPYLKDFAIFSKIEKAPKTIIAFPLKSGNDLNSQISQNLKETTGYLFVKINDKKVISSQFKEIADSQKNPVSLTDFLKENKTNIAINSNLDSLTYYTLRRNSHVLIYPHFGNISKVSDLVDLILIDT